MDLRLDEELNPGGNNLRAFLATIATFESAVGDEGYVMLVGGGRFSDFRDHPANLGWPGIKLPDEKCVAAGFPPGCVSTAAGRYQITRTTWNRLRRRPDSPLKDFSPSSQDAACLVLIHDCDALHDVVEGRFEEAIKKCRGVWASMPGANRKQREHTIEKWRTAFTGAGGAFA